MKMLWILAAAIGIFAQPTLGQTPIDVLESAIQGKQMALRSYAADAVVHYTWSDDKLAVEPMSLHGLVIFTDDSVKLKGGKVIFSGHGETLVRDPGTLARMGKLSMRLEVELQGADSAAVVPQLQDAMFFPDLQSALAGLPESVAKLLPFPSDGKITSTCHCDRFRQDGHWVEMERGPKYFGPTILKGPSPASRNHAADVAPMSGSVALVFIVEDTGRVSEVWVAKPLGADVDESAAKALRQTVFRPAQYDGEPVETVLIQQIQFQSSLRPR